MLNILIRVALLFVMIVVSVLIWKTMEYFNMLPEEDKNKPLLAWDTLILIGSLLSVAIKLLTV